MKTNIFKEPMSSKKILFMKKVIVCSMITGIASILLLASRIDTYFIITTHQSDFPIFVMVGSIFMALVLALGIVGYIDYTWLPRSLCSKIIEKRDLYEDVEDYCTKVINLGR